MTDTSRLDTGNRAGAATWPRPDSRDTDRYGVFFRPDPSPAGHSPSCTTCSSANTG